VGSLQQIVDMILKANELFGTVVVPPCVARGPLSRRRAGMMRSALDLNHA